ncbi:MAG: amino-acid N-acetyltransferase [Gammaproteobacteria bacterium]|nr:amino-acid N-acetyltransferase [Gammaproteobacteria bacterium]
MTETYSQFVSWFRSAAPYIHVHRGKTFVVQIDDSLVYSEIFTDLVHDLALLNSLGIQLVLVYGARHSIEAWLKENDQESTYHDDVRLTDADTMELVKTAAGKLRVEIESKLSMGLGNTPMSNAELRVSSGNYVMAKPAGIIDGVDYQFTGEIRSIDVNAIRSNLDSDEIVLIPPLGYSITGEVFNLSASSLAAQMAIELKADKLIYLIDDEGLHDAEGNVISQLIQTEAEALLQQGSIEESLYLKVAIHACKNGVPRVQLIDRQASGAILQELFTLDGAGTMITASSYDVIRQADGSDIAGILELIEPMEKQGVLVERSREKLELEIGHFTLMQRDNVIIGCAALYPFSEENAAELACFVIHPEYHKQGMGEQLFAMMETIARKNGLKKLFVLTTQAEHWFLERGFSECSLDDLPVEKQDLYNYQRKSRVLTRTID